MSMLTFLTDALYIHQFNYNSNISVEVVYSFLLVEKNTNLVVEVIPMKEK